MKVTEHLKKAKKPLFSLEILPPLKGASIQSIYDTLDPLVEFNPPFIVPTRCTCYSQYEIRTAQRLRRKQWLERNLNALNLM